MKRTIIAMMLVTTPAYADGPFGISAGSSLQDVAAISDKPGENGFIKLASVPRPHPDLFDYQVKLNAAGRVCRINAAREGDDLISARFLRERIRQQIAEKYGPYESKDGPVELAAVTQLMTFPVGASSTTYIWSKKSRAELAEDIGKISVLEFIVGLESDIISVSFDFNGDNSCDDPSNPF
ncbi:MAG: hypothetical protein HWE25_14770 [Alphaproteobacteria bacterium]|nr:hypothetical protein [Alphaproteobacteria bacterium]